MTRTSTRGHGDDDYDDDAPWTTERLSEHGVTLHIVNMLAHGSLRSPIDVKQLALQVRNADYTPRGFNALVIRFQTPKASLLVYRSGKFLIVGSKSEADTHQALDKFRSILKKLSYPSDLSKFTIANVVGSADLGFKVRLEGLAREHSRFCTYEPELFPGLIYRVVKPKCTLLVFVSGKIIITGYKTREEGEDVLCKMFPVLLQYRIRMESFDSDESDDSDGVL
uniref:TATA-box-binding protein n=1 Tax=Globisporangium ultimum (strain ATCC 200006 / CBS 805.95 / DAOM BR144) TaxID=431595 RepID=K3WVG6_GLOUD